MFFIISYSSDISLSYEIYSTKNEFSSISSAQLIVYDSTQLHIFFYKNKD